MKVPYSWLKDYVDISLSPEELANASRDDHLRYFTIFVTTLLSDFARYLRQDAPVDLHADGVAYQEVPFYLSDDELAQAGAAMNQAALPFLENQPAPHRRRRLFAVAIFPDNEPADTPPSQHDGPPTNTTSEE